MVKLIRAVRSAFSIRTHPSALPPSDSESRQREADRVTVSDHSSGNILLQQGRFSTREDIDRERDEALTYEL